MASASSSGIDSSRWHIIYPNYLNSAKTIPEGRRVGKEHGIEHPTAQEIYMVCQQNLRLPCVLEMDKAYPRDWMVRGRVRVLLKNDKTGKALNPDGAGPNGTKGELLKRVGPLIRSLPSRANRPAEQKVQDPVIQLAQQVVGQTGGAGSSGAPGSASTKKEDKKADKKKKKK